MPDSDVLRDSGISDNLHTRYMLPPEVYLASIAIDNDWHKSLIQSGGEPAIDDYSLRPL